MYAITLRKNSTLQIRGYKHRGIKFWFCIIYYKLKGYEVNHD